MSHQQQSGMAMVEYVIILSVVALGSALAWQHGLETATLNGIRESFMTMLFVISIP